MLLGSVVISFTSLPYFDFDSLPAFVIEKLPVRFEWLWLVSLRVHVASAALAFPLCLAAMSRRLQRRPAWHRRIGRGAGLLLLGGLLPSGLVLSLDAKGGALASAGFLLSGTIVLASLVLGVRAARRRDFAAHRRAMRHVLAQMSVAVSSRALILLSDRLGGDPDAAYVIALWLPVLGSALAVELLSRPPTERIRREESAYPALRRLRAVLPARFVSQRSGR